MIAKFAATAKTFLDSNILVYTLDKNEPDKQKKALDVIVQISHNGVPVISTQVLQEFYNSSTTKLKLDKLYMKSIMYKYKNMEIVQIDFNIIEQGIDISILNQISFWDGLIIAAASFANCSALLTEDLNDGQIIQGVKIRNPFLSP
jgi:predicted nucleic acid-binding protein